MAASEILFQNSFGRSDMFQISNDINLSENTFFPNVLDSDDNNMMNGMEMDYDPVFTSESPFERQRVAIDAIDAIGSIDAIDDISPIDYNKPNLDPSNFATPLPIAHDISFLGTEHIVPSVPPQAIAISNGSLVGESPLSTTTTTVAPTYVNFNTPYLGETSSIPFSNYGSVADSHSELWPNLPHPSTMQPANLHGLVDSLSALDSGAFVKYREAVEVHCGRCLAGDDDKLMKKILRKIKNRENSRRSRMESKKKIESLEKTRDAMKEDLELLQKRVDILKHVNATLRNENTFSKSLITSSPYGVGS